MNTLDQALLLTGVGMGLVFLALALVMAVIAVLERIFRPAAKADAGTTAELIPAMAVAAPAAAAAPAAGEAAAIAVALDQRKRNEVAAIAAAILMQRQKQSGGKSPFQRYADLEGVDIQGEVVTVTDIDAGAGTWKGYGRVNAIS